MRTDACITCKDAATVHGMKVIQESIETDPRNYSRFVVIGTEHHEKRDAA